MRVSRRKALVYLGVAGAPVAVRPVFAQGERVKVADLTSLAPLKPVNFTYPDENSPAVLLDMGRPTYMGVGPRKSIVAYSVLCQHMGCPTSFDPERRLLVCPCHMSLFDPSRGGLCLEGPAISRLPRILLQVAEGSVYAVGVAYGLIYGRASNA
ncbi:arsenate reductase (azurin) small subunit [Thermus sp.]|uniref:arsenate reductase (azurin) small subunit n=1 Tax=Thermus sp. TaxID=275 RepID=UPI00391C12A7